MAPIRGHMSQHYNKQRKQTGLSTDKKQRAQGRNGKEGPSTRSSEGSSTAEKPQPANGSIHRSVSNKLKLTGYKTIRFPKYGVSVLSGSSTSNLKRRRKTSV